MLNPKTPQTEKSLWVEIEIKNVPEHIKEIITYLISELGSSGIWENDDSMKLYFKKDKWSKEKEKKLLDLVKTTQNENQKIKISIREFPDQNWNELWEKSIEPIKVGENIIIKPTWKEYKATDDKIVIQIDPKMSFGTGHHETTRLMLKAIEKYIYPKCKVLDVGTGTGILAIAAIKLDAKEAVGIDNDEWAFQNARENAQINGVENKLKIILGSIENVKETNFDIILANIDKNTIISMMEQLYNKLKNGGILITSGYLETEREAMEKHLKMHNFEIIDILKENEWLAIVAKKYENRIN